MADPWPSSLPSLMLLSGQTIDPVSTSTPIEVESGEPLSRRRFTGEMDRLTGTLRHVTTSQAQTLLEFWRDDLENGTLRFIWFHPISNAPVETLFMAPPKFAAVSADLWRVSLDLQTMPA